MDKIASPDELQAELRKLVAYAESEQPSREKLAAEMRNLASRVTGYRKLKMASEADSERELYRRVIAMALAIGSLERSAKGLARKLERQGLKVEVDVFRSGRGGDPSIGSGMSYVELEVTASYKDEEGDDKEAYSTLKFYANEYEGDSRHGEFGGVGVKWRQMAKDAVEYLKKDLKNQDYPDSGKIKVANSSVGRRWDRRLRGSGLGR